jgi:hypothetical protein
MFANGSTRETRDVWSKISRRNFWPGSKRRTLSDRRLGTVADMLINEIPIRELKKTRPFAGGGHPGHRSWLNQWDGAGDMLHPRPRASRHRFPAL